MKQNKLIIILAVISIYSFALMHKVNGCSMFEITMLGKTMVGNNEDYWNPNTRIWFEQGKNGEYGAAYVGFDNFWPQGGMNQAGLVFDGFAEDYLAIKDTLGKKSLGVNFLEDIMKKCATVDDARKYFSRYNLSGLETSMFFFVDKTGRYLVVEGDSLITGNKEYYIVSNFYPSQVKDETKIPIPLYHKGKKLLESHRDTTVSFCASVMDTMHQEKDWGGGTMYTTIYDLNEGTIYLYYFHDYTHVVKFSLNHELEKEDYSLVIPELFPENRKGQDFFNNYNAISNELDLFKDEGILKDSLRYTYVTNTLFAKDIRLISIFSNKVNEIGNLWMDKENYGAAINVFRVNVKLSPDSWVAYEVLADAYMKNKQFEPALANYEKSIEINPDNSLGKQQIKILKELIKR
ncbi:MAG: tetratricopeptide repeat protein [Candidatus Zixiibacteriota bacterium]